MAEGQRPGVTKGGAFRIVHLLDAPQAAPTLARWFVEAWAPYYTGEPMNGLA